MQCTLHPTGTLGSTRVRLSALLAEVDETWTTPVNTRSHELGGIVFRRLRTLSDISAEGDHAQIGQTLQNLSQTPPSLMSGKQSLQLALRCWRGLPPNFRFKINLVHQFDR